MTDYEKPILEVMEIKREDIVCTSFLNPGENGDGDWIEDGWL